MESESSGNILDEDDIKPDVESIKIEVEAEAVVAQHEATKGNNLFHIDRTLIQEVGIEEQDQELRSLGLSVYHQDELEQGILQQVDQALEMQEREDEKRRLEKQIKDVTEDIRCEEQQLSKDETLLRVMKGGSVSVTHAFKVRKDQEMCRNRLTALKAKEKILLSKKAALETGSQDTNEESNENDGILNKKSSGESEHERMIRLGEMTPFGTILANRLMSGPSGSKSSAPKKLTDFQRYLNSQAALEKSHVKPSTSSNTASPSEASCSKDLTSRHKSPLKPSVLNPHKRKIKEKLGCKIGRGSRARAEKPAAQMSETQTIWLDDSDPDFLPDENGDIDDFSPPAKKKKAPVRKAKKQRPLREPGSGSEWGSDDDDWESSGDEEKVAKKRKKGKEMDDGNLADYNARIKLWEKERGDEDVTSSHHLCGGLEVPSVIWNKLYKYQQVGVQWMWELFQNGTGGILGDEMGLGKTIQIIAFLAALKHSQMKDTHTGFRGLGASIVVCPTTVMHQWVKEFHVWYPPIRVAVLHDSGNFDGTRNSLIREMSQCKGILITSYQGLVKHQEALLSRSWHLIILDEGHKIRNPDAQATLAAKRVPTPHRLALTGSPMQNNLKELWSLFDFVYPSKLGTLPDFLANFAVPITQGGYANASEVQVATAYHCALSLKETIKPYLLRRMKHDVKNHIQLPSKNEQVLFCKLTEEQRSLYRQYVDSRLVSNILEGRTKIFVGLINLRKICNHPDLFSGKNKLAQDDESIPEDEHYGYWERSGKMAVVQSLLKIWHKQGHRVLLFTQGRQMICILENFVQKEGYSYLKLDGATSIGSRQPLIAEFNNNPSHFVFLLTTRVGGLGVNLTGADRVVIFDPDWNPATDTQARERAWRIGQKKQVTIYRLVTAGTIEEKIYHRQIFKQFLSNKVLNDPKQRRFFKTNDLYELFTLKEANNNSTETSAIFAGTGSEVRVDTSKRKYKHTSKPIDIEPQPVTKPNKIEFSQDKINHMKQLAQKLSQQFASKLANKTETSERDKKNVNVETCERSKEDRTVQRDNEKTKDKTSSSEQVDTTSIVKKIENGFDIKTEAHSSKKTDKNSQPGSSRDTSSRERSYESSSRDKSYERSSNKKHKKHKKHDRKEGHRHRKKGAKFEGERIKHLVNQRDYADLVGKNEEEEESKDENQDDYVLRKLFKKSGLQTALKHDTIMQGGGSDYALVEREARHVAQEAMTRLKESQRQCFRADAGVPTWTGLNGLIKAPPRDKNKAAKKAKPSAALGKAPDPEPEAKKEEQKEEVEEEKEEEKKKDLISGDDLLSMWQKRNRLLRAPSPDRAPTPEHVSGPEFTDEEGPVPGEEELDMLADLPDVEEEEEEQEEASLFDLEPPEQRPRAAAAARRSHPQMEAPSTRNTYVTEEETDLLDELRSYLAFGGSISGQASTEELLARFPNSALPTGMAPLFKCLLQSLADFHRNTSAVGIWRLKPEFR